MATTRAWGIGGLLAFEAILFAYTLGLGSTVFAVIALVAAAALGYALWSELRGEGVPALALGVLALATLWRAWAQTFPGMPIGLAVTYVVPLGFALMAVAAWRGAPRAALAGIVLVALVRSWFILFYFSRGGATIAVANLLGAAGAWLWAAASLLGDEGDAARAEAPHAEG